MGCVCTVFEDSITCVGREVILQFHINSVLLSFSIVENGFRRYFTPTIL